MTYEVVPLIQFTASLQSFKRTACEAVAKKVAKHSRLILDLLCGKSTESVGELSYEVFDESEIHVVPLAFVMKPHLKPERIYTVLGTILVKR